jgi:hypothetical protein
MAIAIQEADGSPLLTSITTLIFDQADGFVVSQPAANQARIDLSLTGYTDEQAQDAVGGILTDSATIDFTYDDDANTITAIVKASSIGNTHVGGAAPGSSSFTPGAIPCWIEVTKTHSDLAAAATTNDIEIYSLPAGAVVHHAAIHHTVQFTGAGFFNYAVNVGKTGTANHYCGPRDMLAAVNATPTAGTTFNRFENYDAAISVRLFANSFGANLNVATAGTVKVYLLVSKPKP